MWRYEQPPRYDLPDVARFAETVNAHAAFFADNAAISVGRAPGRLDLMGGIADYSGSLVLELPLAIATFVAAQPASTPQITIHSIAADLGDADREVTLPLDAVTPPDSPLSYADAHALLTSDPHRSWAAYVAGVLVVLQRERGLRLRHGLRLLVASDVPTGKGVSSSAAIEVATMMAVLGIRGQGSGIRKQKSTMPPPDPRPLTPDPREIGILCQMVENLVVGAPCGVMDQMTSACGEQDSLLALLCQPAELLPTVRLPDELEVWGIDSGIRHAVTGADYGSVRVGAFMGYRIIQQSAVSSQQSAVSGQRSAVSREQGAGGRKQLGDWRLATSDWRLAADELQDGGYLANIPPSIWEQHYRERVPEQIGGAEFLAHYGGTTDTVTTVDPARTYAVRSCAAHPIYEHYRVRLFRTLLESVTTDHRPPTTDGNTQSIVLRPSSFVETCVLLGELMYQSHASYSACGLGSDGTDRLVELVRAAGAEAGLYGAKITGGGSGGTVAVLARRGANEAVHRVAAQYEQETGRQALVIGGSSPGAAQFGTLRMVREN